MPKTFNLKPFQDKYIFSEAKFPAMVSAWGTGKTMCGITRAMLHSNNYPNNLGVIFRREFTDLRDSTLKDFELYTSMKVDSSREAKLKNGSQIMFRHLEEIRNLQNINLGWFLIEQGEELVTDEQFFTLFGRLRRAGVPHWGSVIANTRGHNWIWKLWKQGSLAESELIEATTHENMSNLPADFAVTLENLKKEKPKMYACYVLNSWDEVTGQYFDTWDNQLHVIPPFQITDEFEIYMCMDWGYAKPAAIKWWAVAPGGDRAYCMREYYKTRVESPVMAQEIHDMNKAMFGEHYIRDRRIKRMYADPSIFTKSGQTGKSIYEDFAEVLKEKQMEGDSWNGKYDPLLIVPSNNSRIHGWNIFRDMLAIQDDGLPKAMWFNTCTHSIETTPVLQHDEHKPEDLDTEGEDHCADADRYFFVERFGGKKIEPAKEYTKLTDPGSRREWELVEHHFEPKRKSLSRSIMSVGR